MERLLNRGLNFSILPLKLDLTQVLVDYRKFERSVIWHEFWHGRDKENEYIPPIFRTEKMNLPKNYVVPEALKTFLCSVKSELLDPRNRNVMSCNLPQDEIQALKELIRLQRERIIVIKACDKGAGIIILEFSRYMQACYSHLFSEQKIDGAPSRLYYNKVDDSALQVAKDKILLILEEGLNNKIISKEEYIAMKTDDKKAAKFYCNFKVHKEHEAMETPPPRPIISGSGSIIEGIGYYVEHHIKNLSNTHHSYIQDSPDFLRVINKVNEGPKLLENTILVVFDVKALYTNIIHEQGLNCLEAKLQGRINPQVPTGFIIRLMEIILKYNIFTFNGDLYKQEIGAAMGSPPIPSYANIFMAEIDKLIVYVSVKYSENGIMSLQLLKRFLDDIFVIFVGSTRKLHMFYEEVNNIHPAIKLTMNHTSIISETSENKCKCIYNSSVPFLDVLCTIKNGKIKTDLYKKETDRNQYLLTSSCHPSHCTKNIPFSLGLRIVRICSDPLDRDHRLSELKTLLQDRGYSERNIDAAISKAKKIPREKALKKVSKNKNTERPVFALTYDPRLPPIQQIQSKHWRSMKLQDPYLAEVFPQPPLTAFRKQKNIRDHIIRAQIANPIRDYAKGKQNGMTKCGNNCTACPYILEKESLDINTIKWKIKRKVNCNSYNMIYMIICNTENCMKMYIGESKRGLKFRLADHRGYIVNKNINQATGAHFNLPGHNLANLSVIILEQVKNKSDAYRKEREKYLISKFNTYYKGLNRQN